MGILSPFELGILWATSSKSGDKWILKNEDRYFAERIQKINGGKIFPLRHDRKGTILWTLDIKRLLWEDLLSYGYTGRTDLCRIFPKTQDDARFAAAYIQCHSTLSTNYRKTKYGRVRYPTLRIHGAPPLIERLNQVITNSVGVGVKTPQTHGNKKMSYLAYQAKDEVEDICNWIISMDHSPRFESKANEIQLLLKPDMEY